MKELIDKLFEQKKALTEKLNNLDQAIKSIQKICSHTTSDGKDAMKYVGHDSHKDHYECEICKYSSSY